MHVLQTSIINYAFFVASAISQSLPTVDLGYEVHRAIALNVHTYQTPQFDDYHAHSLTLIPKASGGYYNFSNIPYAEPPIGALRFAKPIPPKQTDSSTINNGSVEHICPQGQPFINAINTKFLEYYIADNTSTFPFAQLNDSLYAESTAQLVPRQDPRVSEDCLLLDVMVPRQVFNNSTTPSVPQNSSAGLPVLVWIHGGGFGSNSKEEVGNPAGLIKDALEADGEGVVYVAMNYRVSKRPPSSPCNSAFSPTNIGEMITTSKLTCSSLERLVSWRDLLSKRAAGLRTMDSMINAWLLIGCRSTSTSSAEIQTALPSSENPRGAHRLCSILLRTAAPQAHPHSSRVCP